MRVFKRVGITLALVLFLSIILTGLQIYFDMIKREEDLNSFIRLSVKDAIVNIQTTEESGLNFATSHGGRQTAEKYAEYLNALARQTDSSSELKLIYHFLEENSSTSGDSRFRPIQFGMTYVDKSLFIESFISSLQKLVDSNYGHLQTDHQQYRTSAIDTLVIKNDESITHGFVPNGKLSDRTTFSSNVDDYGYDMNIQIDGPKLVELDKNLSPEDKEIYGSLYGNDMIDEYISLKTPDSSLGISSESMPNFFIYYDIKIVVGWASISTNPLLKQSFLGRVWGVDDSYFSRNNGYLMIPGRPIEYTYRYILLN